MVTRGRTTLEDLLVSLQKRQEADVEENRKAFAVLHDIVAKVGNMVVDLSKKSIEGIRGESSSSTWNRDIVQQTKVL